MCLTLLFPYYSIPNRCTCSYRVHPSYLNIYVLPTTSTLHTQLSHPNCCAVCCVYMLFFCVCVRRGLFGFVIALCIFSPSYVYLIWLYLPSVLLFPALSLSLFPFLSLPSDQFKCTFHDLTVAGRLFCFVLSCRSFWHYFRVPFGVLFMGASRAHKSAVKWSNSNYQNTFYTTLHTIYFYVPAPI